MITDKITNEYKLNNLLEMEKITDNRLWNVYYEHCGTTSKEYFVSEDDNLQKNMSFVNDEAMALQVCDALNKCGVGDEDSASDSGLNIDIVSKRSELIKATTELLDKAYNYGKEDSRNFEVK